MGRTRTLVGLAVCHECFQVVLVSKPFGLLMRFFFVCVFGDVYVRRRGIVCFARVLECEVL